MKTLSFKSLSVLALTLALVGSAEAREKATKAKAAPQETTTTATVDHVETHRAATSSSGSAHFGLGYSSLDLGNTVNSTATGMLQLNDAALIQFYLTIPSTSPFGILGGGAFKYTIAGNSHAGFHVGGGAILGSIQKEFAMVLSGLAGVHFMIPSTPISVHFDGGPALAIYGNGAGGTNTDFRLTSLSSLLGLSVVYFF